MLAHVPPWVFGVFALLLTMGLLLSRPRAVHPTAPLLIAFGFIVYSLYGVVSSFDASPAHLVPWLVGLLTTARFGQRVFGPRGMTTPVTGTRKVLVPGSWWPLALMMGIFLVKFIVGFARGAHLPLANQPWFGPAVAGALGGLSGGFTARALGIRRAFLAAPGRDASLPP